MGRYKLIESPEKMWELFVAYKESAKKKPILVQDFVGKDGMEVRRERERPLTMEGFENYCFEKGIMSDLSHYFANLDGRYADYVAICRTIRRVIREDQISGGMAGIYNPSITQRLNNLVEKTDTKTEGIQKITIERVSKNTD
jgi:hypothetical protein